jgi:hypothetical protein
MRCRMWKVILQVAVAVGLDKWAKRKAEALVEKIAKKAEKKAASIKEAIESKVEKWLGEDEHGNKVVVERKDGKVIVRRVR